jgi:mono/diheme cytochrome c family protein
MEKSVGPLTDEEIQTLVDLLKSPDVRDRIAAESERVALAMAAKFDPPDAAVGELLFTGGRSLENGGGSCAACHSVDGRGGGLGPDLKGVFAKMGETPLVSACEKTAFKIMDAAYRDHPVTRQEALHLAKYLAVVAEAPAGPAVAPVGAIGAGAAAAALAAIVLGYRRRGPAARKTLLRRRNRVLD